jgi:MULE transposase domain/FAR1 DNA-binding domain
MSTFERSTRAKLRRQRIPSASDEAQREKRRCSGQQASSSPSVHDRPQSSSSSTASIGYFYGVGDDNALDNLFASFPQTFSSLPRPHGSQGLHEPAWDLRSDHEIYLQNDFFRGRRRSQRVRTLIPGPELDPFASEPPESPPSSQHPPTRTRTEFESAMHIVREVIGEGRGLTIDLARSYERVRAWRERWGWSPLSSDAYDSPPPYSPPRSLPPQPSQTSSTLESLRPTPIRQSLSPPPEPIPNPIIPGDPAPSADALFNTVNIFAKENGFGIVRRNQYSYKGRIIRYSFQCDRFGQPRASEGSGLRSRKSRKCGCEWKVTAESLEKGKWLLRQHKDQKHRQHNHKRSITPSAHLSHRRLTAPVKAAIESASRRAGIRASDVAAIVEEQFPDSTLMRKDIYNARSLINREKLNGYTPTAALIKLFDEKKVPYIAKWADDDPDRLVGLVWTFPYCLQMWRRFPEVISFDNTYNTNRFKLPLFQATGQTCLGTVYNAAFGLIDNERREGFQFLAESIRDLITKHSIRQPDVIITDFDKAMKAALNDQFPNIQQQLCIHHILSNVLLKSKTKWTGEREDSTSPNASDNENVPSQTQVGLTASDKHLIQNSSTSDKVPHTYQGVVMMWKEVLYAETEKAFEQAWRDLCKEFDDQRAILQYLYRTYLPVSAQWARCFIRHYRNFGIRVTSGTEASNNNVKNYLLNGMSHLYRLVEAMQDMIHDQERTFKDACGQDDILTAPQYLGSIGNYLGELRTTISSKGLGLINKQYRIARKFLPTGKNPFPDSIGTCGNDCTVSIELGIPCYHKVYAKLDSATPFTKWEVHPRWRLRESVSQDPYRRILDPKIATTLRGRPKNTAQAVPAGLAVTASNQHAGLSTRRRRGRPAGSLNKSTLAKKAQRAPQEAIAQSSSKIGTSTRRQASGLCPVLSAGKTTGVRYSGRSTQPNIRRTRSQWELAKGDQEDAGCIIVRQ